MLLVYKMWKAEQWKAEQKANFLEEHAHRNSSQKVDALHFTNRNATQMPETGGEWPAGAYQSKLGSQARDMLPPTEAYRSASAPAVADDDVSELTIDDLLTQDLLINIFNFLQAACLVRAVAVSTFWRDCVTQCCDIRVPNNAMPPLESLLGHPVEVTDAVRRLYRLQLLHAIRMLELTTWDGERITDPDRDVRTISSTESVVYMIDKEGNIAAWPQNNPAQNNPAPINPAQAMRLNLAEGRTLRLRNTVFDGDFRTLASGPSHAAAVSKHGKLFTWGENDLGELGHGNYVKLEMPTPISLPYPVQKVACGDAFTLVLSQKGYVYSCGDAANGCLGRVSTGKQPKLVEIPGMRAVDVAAGHGHGLAVAPDGSLKTWGAGYAGQLGNGERGNVDKPMPITILADFQGVERPEKVCQVSAGELHSLCLCASGRAYHFGEVVGEEKDNLVPKRLLGIPAQIRRVVALNQRSLVIAETGEAFVIAPSAPNHAPVPLEKIQQLVAMEQNLIAVSRGEIHVLDESFEEITQREAVLGWLRRNFAAARL